MDHSSGSSESKNAERPADSRGPVHDVLDGEQGPYWELDWKTFCDILTKNLVAFCRRPESWSKVSWKGKRPFARGNFKTG